MYRVTKVIEFCYGHRLMDYEGKSKALHGHSARLLVTLGTEMLDETGFVREFGEVKRTIKDWVDKIFDHVMLMRSDDPFLTLLKEHNEPIFEMELNPTSENICKIIFDYAESEGLPVLEVQLWETPTSSASYRKGNSV